MAESLPPSSSSNGDAEALLSSAPPSRRPSDTSSLNSIPHHNHNPDIVELATLKLPSHAVNSGMETGQSDHVILEATQETIEHLTSDLQDHPQQNCLSQISAVVDLEILSELVGISEEEFIADLHADANEQNHHAHQHNHSHHGGGGSITSSHTGNAKDKIYDEETPLLSAAITTGTEVQLDKTTMEDQQQYTAAPTSTADFCITLPADAFIETLADVLHTHEQQQQQQQQLELDNPNNTNTNNNSNHNHMPPMAEETEQQVLAETTGSGRSTPTMFEHKTPTETPTEEEEEDDHVEAAATKTEDDQHLCHDAFLLNIPTTDGDGDKEDHFVLALPEIVVEASQADASQLSLRSHDMNMMDHPFPFLNKALSILPDGKLPTDVTTVHLEAHTHEPTKEDPAPLHLELVVKHKVPIIGYVILISGLVALASVGAALDLQEGPSPTLKTLWRQLATSMVLLPFVIRSIRRDGIPKLTRYQWLQLPLCAMAYAYMTLAFVLALTMTTMANAFVLSNMTSLVIIAGRAALGMPVLRSEGIGAVIGFIGAAICANDASRTLAKAAALMATTTALAATSSSDAMLGNIIALSASFGTACYLIVAKSLRSSMDLFVFIFTVMLLGSCFLTAYIVLNGEDFSWGMHPDHGMWGWLCWWMPDRLPLELFMAIVCNCLGTTGYIAVMKYFEPIVPATVMLMEPVVGALLGVAAGTAKLPGLQTWFGDVIVAIGTFCVIWSGSKKTEKIDATSALRPTGMGGGGDDDDASIHTITSIVKSPFPRKPGPAHRRNRSIDTQDTPTKVVWDHT